MGDFRAATGRRREEEPGGRPGGGGGDRPGRIDPGQVGEAPNDLDLHPGGPGSQAWLHRSRRPVRLEPGEREARTSRGLVTGDPARLPQGSGCLTEVAARVCLVPTPVPLGGRGGGGKGQSLDERGDFTRWRDGTERHRSFLSNLCSDGNQEKGHGSGDTCQIRKQITPGRSRWSTHVIAVRLWKATTCLLHC